MRRMARGLRDTIGAPSKAIGLWLDAAVVVRPSCQWTRMRYGMIADDITNAMFVKAD
jgi:hypothetical protein